MSLGITHFAVGAIGICVILHLFHYQGRWAPWMVASGVWAMIPDGHTFIPWLTPSFHQSVYANVFWFHRVLDVTDAGDSRIVGGAVLAVLGIVSIIARCCGCAADSDTDCDPDE